MPSVCLKYQILALIYFSVRAFLPTKNDAGHASPWKLVTVPTAIAPVSRAVWGLETLCDGYDFLQIMHYPLPILYN